MYPQQKWNKVSHQGHQGWKSISKFAYKGSINYQGENNQEPNKPLPAFQINRFKETVCLRFNEEFINEVLRLSSGSKKSELVSSLLKDIEDLLNDSGNECFVSDCYHVGKIGNCVYLNMNNKCCAMLFDFLNGLVSFPPHILAFKQRLEKMSIQGKMHDSMSHSNYDEEDENCDY